MELGDIRDVLATWIAAVTGLKTVWRERSQSFGATRMELHLGAFRGIGLDEVTEEYDASTVLDPTEWGTNPAFTPGGFTPSQNGQRVSTFEVRAETQNQENNEDALYYVQLVRDRMALPEVSAALAAVGAGFGNILLEPTDITRTQDMRRLSVAQMDVQVNAASNVEGTPYGHIATAEMVLEGLNEDGSVRTTVTEELELT